MTTTLGALRLGCIMLCVAVLAGCASPRVKAPVEERSAAAPGTAVPPPPPAPAAQAAAPAALPASAPGSVADTVKPPPPGAENAGKPGYYTAKAGDTVKRIAELNGLNWRDVARWNNLDNPNVLEVGQVLRIVPPAPDPTVAAVRPVPGAGRVETRPLDGKPGAPLAGASTPAAPATPSPPVTAAREPDDDIVWVWPASGAVLAGFDEGKNKGLTIAGSAGDPVLAAGDGRVVYAGSSLRGYGNLVIVKHNETYLTAYAHNRVLLVKDDQVVHRGQRIAEMGSTDAPGVQLHFEIRRQGKPIDPAKLLPPR
jgi:lipoprotein NlpD